MVSENEIERDNAESSDVLKEISNIAKRDIPLVKPILSPAFQQRGLFHLPAMETSQHRWRQESCVKKITVYSQVCDLCL